jgi:hypothetical protein
MFPYLILSVDVIGNNRQDVENAKKTGLASLLNQLLETLAANCPKGYGGESLFIADKV